jgi:AraC-like DNA-binding protein
VEQFTIQTLLRTPAVTVTDVVCSGACRHKSDDLSALGLDLGFSSHSHFSAAFRQAYGRLPTAFRQSALNR